MKKWLKKTLTVLSCTLMVFCISCGLFACKEHPHTFEEISTTATCIAEGERTLVCECGAVKTEHAEKISHDFSKQDASEKYYAGGPDCVAGDKYYYSCSMCGLADTSNTFSIGDGLGHTWKNVEDDKYLVEIIGTFFLVLTVVATAPTTAALAPKVAVTGAANAKPAIIPTVAAVLPILNLPSSSHII